MSRSHVHAVSVLTTRTITTHMMHTTEQKAGAMGGAMGMMQGMGNAGFGGGFGQQGMMGMVRAVPCLAFTLPAGLGPSSSPPSHITTPPPPHPAHRAATAWVAWAGAWAVGASPTCTSRYWKSSDSDFVSSLRLSETGYHIVCGFGGTHCCDPNLSCQVLEAFQNDMGSDAGVDVSTVIRVLGQRGVDAAQVK